MKVQMAVTFHPRRRCSNRTAAATSGSAAAPPDASEASGCDEDRTRKRRAVPYLQPGSGASVRAWLILFRVKLPASQQVASQRQAIAHALGRVSEDENETTPCLVISPFSAGGYKYSGALDHTSTLRLIESRFKVTVPT